MYVCMTSLRLITSVTEGGLEVLKLLLALYTSRGHVGFWVVFTNYIHERLTNHSYSTSIQHALNFIDHLLCIDTFDMFFSVLELNVTFHP